MADEVKVSVFMSQELRDRLGDLAKKDGRSLARFIEKQMEALAAKMERANG
jgi:predicted DNA-binding protein